MYAVAWLDHGAHAGHAAVDRRLAHPLAACAAGLAVLVGKHEQHLAAVLLAAVNDYVIGAYGQRRGNILRAVAHEASRDVHLAVC